MAPEAATALGPATLVKGDDPVLIGEAVRQLVDDAVGDGDRAAMLTELDAATFEDDNGSYSTGPLVDAAQTPPFLAERRVVVGRQLGVFSTTDSVEPIVRYLADPLPTTVLILAWERGPRSGSRLPPVPKALSDAVSRASGTVLDTKPGTGRNRRDWVDERLGEAAVHLDAAARTRLVDHLGEEVSRLGILLDTFESTFGPGARLSVDDIEPYLGEAGDVAPWELTDAIDRGDTQASLSVLTRMLAAGRHPLQITASLHGHYQRMLRLDGSGVGTEAEAAEVLGLRGSTFPARKALQQARTLGSDRIREFVCLLADADLDLRGAKAWPDELVVEVLVARLASRTPSVRSRRS
jgi:DNA polymerase-3 subunit delta